MKKITPILILLSFILSQCTDKKQADNSLETNDTALSNEAKPKNEPNTSDEIADFKFGMVLANTPSPLEILNDLNKSKINYHQEIILDAKKYQNAMSLLHKALYMGAYSIDMNYQINYGQSQEALKYMVGIKKISDDLNISQYYDKRFYECFNKNIGNKDSLMKLTDEAFSLTDNLSSSVNSTCN